MNEIYVALNCYKYKQQMTSNNISAFSPDWQRRPCREIHMQSQKKNRIRFLSWWSDLKYGIYSTSASKNISWNYSRLCKRPLDVFISAYTSDFNIKMCFFIFISVVCLCVVRSLNTEAQTCFTFHAFMCIFLFCLFILCLLQT